MSSPQGAFAVADLLALPADADKIAYLRSEGLANETGLGWLLDRAEECVHDDPSATSSLVDLCRMAARSLEFAEVGARAAYLEARVLAEHGELSGALTLIKEARDLWSGSGHPLQAARTDLGRMQILDDLGQHAAALEVGNRLLDELGRLEVEPDAADLRQWIRAAALENIGVASGFTGDHERALQAYEAAEETYLALNLPEETARPRANRGIELFELGRTTAALVALRSAEASFRAAGDRLWSAKCLGHIANVLEQRGELHEALRILQPARRTLEELGADVEAVRLRLAIARVYLAVGLGAEAQTEASIADEQALALGLVHDAANARFIGALGQAAEGNLAEAEEGVRAAAALFREVGDRQYLARAILAEADVVGAQQRQQDARHLAARAVEALTAGHWLIPLTWAELRCFDTAASSESAAAHLQTATELADRLRLPQLRYECDVRKARLHRRQGAESAAEQLLRGAVDWVDQAGADLPDSQLRRAFRADRLAAHDELIDLLIGRGREADVREALALADRSKNQTLEELRDRTIGVRPAVQRDNSASDKTASDKTASDDNGVLGDLRADLNAAYAALLTAEPRQAAVLQLRAADLERRLSALRMRTVIEAGPTDLATPMTRSGRGATLPEVAVEFHVLGDDVLAFVACDGGVEVRRLPAAMPEVIAQLARLGSQWSRFRMGAAFARRHLATLTDTSREILAALHRVLLAPIEPLLGGVESDRFVVVPHRRLHAVPFHALHDGDRYLVERWAVTVSPSLTGRRERRRVLEQNVVVLAVPDANAPSVAREATALAALLPSARVLVGVDATTEALRASVPGPSLLHIACHGLYRSANPLFSSLRLADRWLTAAEVLDLDLDGAVVTLSACESGRDGGTAEPVGLGWAFLAAGAAGVLVSHWVAHDDVTADLMTEMYRLVSRAVQPGEALRQAQRKIMDQHPHPYYWAAFAYVSAAGGPERDVPHDSHSPP